MPAACQKGISVSFTTAAALVNEMMEAREDRRLVPQNRMTTHRRFVIHEIGFAPLSKTGAELLFGLVSRCFGRLTGAHLDRFTVLTRCGGDWQW